MTKIATVDDAVTIDNLADLADQPRWVAWRTETRKGKPTKIPYDPHTGRQAEIPTNPATWGTCRKAEHRWQQLDNGSGGGIGVVLGDLGNGYHLLGLDLDQCINEYAENVLDIDPFANAIIERFDTYAEVSPSKKGVKLFFLVRNSSMEAVKEAFGVENGKAKTRRSFAAGEHLEIAIDRARFYAVTDDFLTDHRRLRVVVVDDVRWFITEAGPQFQRLHRPASVGERPRTYSNDQSGSGYGFRFLATLKGAGESFEDAFTAILADRGKAGEWARRVDARQLQRAWDRAQILNPAAPLECVRAFVQSCGEVALVYHRGGFYQWHGSHYEECDDDLLRSKLYEFLEGCFTLKANNKMAPFNPTAHRVNQIIDALKAGVGYSSRKEVPFWLDEAAGHPEASNLIACRNGLFDLSSRALLPHTALLFNVNCLPFDYDPEAPDYPPQWMEFLRQLWPGDKGKPERLCLQEMFGLALTSITRMQKMFLLLGPKRSGKGTIARVLTALLGPDNVVNPTLASLSSEFGLSPLIGKRIAIVSDARLGDRANAHAVVERLLNLSGEDDLTINRKYRNHWTGRLNVRVLLLSNELPRVTDSSGAFASRFILLTLRTSFLGREDTELTQKLLSELPSILNWSLRGLERLLRRGYFEMPESSLQAIRQFEDLTSPVGAFVRDWCQVDPKLKVKVKHLYEVWKLWCEQEGQLPGSSIVLGRNLRAVLPQLRATGRGGRRVYLGLALNGDAQEV